MEAVPRLAAEEANRVFKPARQFHVHLGVALVFHGVLEHGGREGGIIGIERDEGREGLEADPGRAIGITVFDVGNRVFTDEGNVAPVRAFEGPLAGLAAGREPEGEAVIEGRGGPHRLGVMLGARADIAVENIPMPQFSIAAQVKLAGTYAADRHPDLVELRAAIDGALAAGGERCDPFGPQLLVRRDQFLEVLPCERAGHGLELRKGQGAGAQAQEFEEITAKPGGGAGLL